MASRREASSRRQVQFADEDDEDEEALLFEEGGLEELEAQIERTARQAA